MRLIIAISMLLSLCACSLSAKKAPEKRYYRFDEPMLQQKIPSLNVKRPSAMGIIGNRPMVARNTDGSLVQMQHNFWLESPKILLYNYLVKMFEKQPQAQTLFTLNTQILELEKHQQQAIVALKFIVTNETNQVVFNKTYRQQHTLKENTIPAFVDAVLIILKEITNQLHSDMP